LKSIKGNKVFPEYIFTSSKEEMLSFLAGYLDSDGTINIGDKQRQGVSISSTRKDFLQKTQLLLTLFGVYSSINSSKKPHNFYDKRYNKIYNSNKIVYRLLISQSTINNLKGFENYLTVNYKKQDFIKIIESNHYNKNFSILEVTSIENQEPQEVFDITVPPDFIWVTNGIKSYDC
jgi:intein/homing endonuclease